MSTMYYTWPGKVAIGQRHAKGKAKGTHFTWTIWPADLATHIWQAEKDQAVVVDEYNQYFTWLEFLDIVGNVSSMSFEWGIV